MKKAVLISITSLSLCATLLFGFLLIRNQRELQTLRQEINQYTKSNKDDQKKIEELNDTIAELRINKNNLQSQIDALKKRLEKYEPDPFKEAIEAIKTLDPDVFVTDPENYAPTDQEIRITAKQAAVIAQKGFEESAKRIAGEGTDNIESQTVELVLARPNNYFTHYGKFQWYHAERNCYHFTRTNELKCGVEIYVDATTGLIIGGGSFGD